MEPKLCLEVFPFFLQNLMIFVIYALMQLKM
jgi:hypothetical protein